jgi:hypothetical protein
MRERRQIPWALACMGAAAAVRLTGCALQPGADVEEEVTAAIRPEPPGTDPEPPIPGHVVIRDVGKHQCSGARPIERATVVFDNRWRNASKVHALNLNIAGGYTVPVDGKLEVQRVETGAKPIPAKTWSLLDFDAKRAGDDLATLVFYFPESVPIPEVQVYERCVSEGEATRKTTEEEVLELMDRDPTPRTGGRTFVAYLPSHCGPRSPRAPNENVWFEATFPHRSAPVLGFAMMGYRDTSADADPYAVALVPFQISAHRGIKQRFLPVGTQDALFIAMHVPNGQIAVRFSADSTCTSETPASPVALASP